MPPHTGRDLLLQMRESLIGAIDWASPLVDEGYFSYLNIWRYMEGKSEISCLCFIVSSLLKKFVPLLWL